MEVYFVFTKKAGNLKVPALISFLYPLKFELVILTRTQP